MKIEKKILGELEKAYCLNFIKLENVQYAIAASEKEGGSCILYNPESGEQKTVWENRGGTMTICMADESSEILAVQNFFMKFKAETAKIVCADVLSDQPNSERDYLTLPFVHRFGLISSVDGKAQYIVFCTVTTAKDNTDDWHRPGYVYTCEYNGPDTKPDLKEVLCLHKNHGYWHGQYNGQDVIFVSAEEGLYALYPPKSAGGEFSVVRLFAREIGDAAAVDIDADGEDEIIAIEGFHGNSITVNKFIDSKWETIYRTDAEFAHALWAGEINGVKSFLVGYRKGEAELFMLRIKDGIFEKAVIEGSIATPNIDVIPLPDKTMVLAADRSDSASERVVIYTISE